MFKIDDIVKTKFGSGKIVDFEMCWDGKKQVSTMRYGVELDNKSYFSFSPVYFWESELKQ